MKVIMDIENTTSEGNKIKIHSEVDNQIDLYEINRLYEKYAPRKKIFGII